MVERLSGGESLLYLRWRANNGDIDSVLSAVLIQ